MYFSYSALGRISGSEAFLTLACCWGTNLSVTAVDPSRMAGPQWELPRQLWMSFDFVFTAFAPLSSPLLLGYAWSLKSSFVLRLCPASRLVSLLSFKFSWPFCSVFDWHFPRLLPFCTAISALPRLLFPSRPLQVSCMSPSECPSWSIVPQMHMISVLLRLSWRLPSSAA